MDIENVTQELNRKFAAPLPEYYHRRIIFWHDEEREFEDKLDEIRLDNAKVVALIDLSWYAGGIPAGISDDARKRQVRAHRLGQ